MNEACTTLNNRTYKIVVKHIKIIIMKKIIKISCLLFSMALFSCSDNDIEGLTSLKVQAEEQKAPFTKMLPYNTEKSIVWHLDHTTNNVSPQQNPLFLFPILPD